MAYQDPISKKKIKAGGESTSVHDFHASRNSLRKTQVVANADGSAGFAAPPGAQVVARGPWRSTPATSCCSTTAPGTGPTT